MEDRYVVLPVFINALPMCADPDAIRDMFRYKTMSLAQALPLLPIYGDWKGYRHGRGAIHLAQRAAHIVPPV